MFALLLKDLRNRWVESMLGVVVVAVVVAALLAQRAVSVSAEGKMHDLAHKLGKNMLVVPAATDLTHFYTQRYGAATMPRAYRETLRASPQGQHLGLIQSRLYGNVEVDGVQLVLVGEEIDHGGTIDSSLSPGEAALGAEAARRLGIGVGASLEIGEAKLTVVRVGSSVPGGEEHAIFTALATAQRVLGRPDAVNAMRLAGCWCRLDVPALAASVQQQLPGTRAITVAGMLKAQKGTVAVMKRYSTVLTAAGLLLVVMTIMALTASQVRRQLRELGLLLAIGARPTNLTALFVVKAALIAGSGAVAGFLLGGPFAAQLGLRVLGGSLAPAPGSLLPAAALSVAAGVLAAYVPARRAARLDPTETLREV